MVHCLHLQDNSDQKLQFNFQLSAKPPDVDANFRSHLQKIRGLYNIKQTWPKFCLGNKNSTIIFARKSLNRNTYSQRKEKKKDSLKQDSNTKLIVLTIASTQYNGRSLPLWRIFPRGGARIACNVRTKSYKKFYTNKSLPGKNIQRITNRLFALPCVQRRRNLVKKFSLAWAPKRPEVGCRFANINKQLILFTFFHCRLRSTTWIPFPWGR